MSRRQVGICGLQETRCRGASARLVKGKKSRYKMFWVEYYKRISSVGILLVKKWVEAVFDVKSVLDRIMFIKIVVGKNMGFVKILWIILAYNSQASLDDSVKYMRIFSGHWPKLVLLGSCLLVGISMVTLEWMQMGIRKFMMVEDLRGLIWRVREFLNFLSPTSLLFQIVFSRNWGQRQIDYILVK